MVVAVLSAASSFGFPFQPKHERFRFPREIQGMTKTLGIWASFVYHNNSIKDAVTISKNIFLETLSLFQMGIRQFTLLKLTWPKKSSKTLHEKYKSLLHLLT